MEASDRVSTGSARLDEVLHGGLPRQRATLLVGGPGTGKSTLAMQFLQEGLEREASCLYISTEQTAGELRDSFAPFHFDLDHQNLEVTTLHAAPRDVGPEEELVLRTLEGEADIDSKQVPFTGNNVVRYLEQSESDEFDRIVLDSVSGLEPACVSLERFRRTVIDLFRLFADEFGSTGLFVTEATESNALSYNAHGVIEVARDRIGGDQQRFIRVDKMRGLDHDTRSHLFEIQPHGIEIIRRARETSVGGEVEHVLSTGIDGLDDLLGGGLVNGHATVLEHDGLADRVRIVNAMLTQAFQDEWAVAFVPAMDLHPDQLQRLLTDRVAPMADLLERDQFFVVDPGYVLDTESRNVFFIDTKLREYRSVRGAARHLLAGIRHESASRRVKEYLQILRTIDQRRGDRPLLLLTNTQTLGTVLEATELQQLRHRTHVEIMGHQDTACFIHNPSLIPDSSAEFYRDNAAQVLETWIQGGNQYVTLKKGPSGHLDGTRYVEPTDEPPYVSVQCPTAE